MCKGLSPSSSRPFKLLYHRIYTADSIPNNTTSSYLHTRCVAGGSHTHIASSLRSNPGSTGAAEPQCQVPPSPLSRLVGVSRCWLQQPTTQQPSFHKIAPSLGIPHSKKRKKKRSLNSLLLLINSRMWLVFPQNHLKSHENTTLHFYPDRPLISQIRGY